jgi:hypothetical protein
MNPEDAIILFSYISIALLISALAIALLIRILKKT